MKLKQRVRLADQCAFQNIRITNKNNKTTRTLKTKKKKIEKVYPKEVRNNRSFSTKLVYIPRNDTLLFFMNKQEHYVSMRIISTSL